ncbi:myb-binding protein 1A-like protein [Osmia bicornis bicornis]|uniref:myb-binding protein 1A-like protein n=1 Tax=Osmia bicornis bicornis TaxID=1437191 RepID=UPI0010F88B1C|nr:myb-binding protein 1A-like protein [Osmia bicornis bicornis]
MADESMHMVEVLSNDSKIKEINKMDCTILDYFTKLKSEIESERIDGGIVLLNYLRQQSSEQNDSKEFKYAIKRLIRSLGSSKITSRIGFYTTLTVFLIMHPEQPIDNFLSIVDNELHPVNSNSKSENADIYMGRILAYGALIRSTLLSKSASETQLQILQNLVNAGKQRSYLSFISVSFLVEFINQVNLECIQKSVWPVIEKEFGKPWVEQTLDSFYVLLTIQNKCPSLVNYEFSKKHFGTKSIITRESLSDIMKVLLDLPKIVSCHHPIFKLFCENLVSTDLITDFWTHIDSKFVKPSKTDEHLAIQIFKFILSNVKDKSVLPSLLSPNYMQYMLTKFSRSKKHDKDEILMAFKEILNSLVSIVNNDNTKPKIQIAVLKKLILYPGNLMIEKKTGTKIVQAVTGNLNLEGIKKVSKIYRNIIENTISKEKSNIKTESFWTNAERMYAAHLLTRLMGHYKMVVDQEWRLDQLKFLFVYGFCEISNVGVDLAPQFKEAFYHALDHKLPKLNDLRNILSELVHFVDTQIKNKISKLRNPLTEETKDAWEKVIRSIENLENKSKRAEVVPVFHTMYLHMGLQLFSDPKMAIMAINELQSCYERLQKKSRKGKAGSNKTEQDEPEWVEVVVDLLLSFYSKNNHLLRSLVGCVFPHIRPYVTPTAIHHILAVLDVRSEKTPLVLADTVDEEVSSDTESSSDSEDDSKRDEENDNNESETMSDSDSDSNEESMNEDEDETVTDRLRMAVRQALGDASVQTDDDDVDVDQIDEEEGKQLDESLAAAFKILRENRQTQSKKQEKSAHALTHFRIRVIDLLETYLECNPSMAVALDMLLPLFTLLEYCIKDPHQKPLQDRVRSCLKKLSTVKKFKDTEDINEELLTVILKALIEKGERTTSVYHEMSDKLAECCTFLVRCAQQANLATDTIVQIYGENLTAFFKRRDCVLSPLLFKNILQLHWEDNWQLAPLLVDFAFDSSVRSFRRGYALEFLTVFYNNGRLVHLDTKHLDIRMKMEKKLCKNTINTLKELCDTNKTENEQSIQSNGSGVGKEVKQRYVWLLLSLLRSIRTQHLPEAWNWEEIGNVLTQFKINVTLTKNAKAAYNKLAIEIGIPLHTSVKKNKNKQTSTINGEINEELTNSVEQEDVDLSQENGDTQTDTDITTLKKSELKKRKKSKSKQKDKQLLKKEARMLREKAMSEGFESFSFSSFALSEEASKDESLQNGDSQTTVTSRNTSQKRILRHNLDSNKSKRRKSMEID